MPTLPLTADTDEKVPLSDLPSQLLRYPTRFVEPWWGGSRRKAEAGYCVWCKMVVACGVINDLSMVYDVMVYESIMLWWIVLTQPEGSRWRYATGVLC